MTKIVKTAWLLLATILICSFSLTNKTTAQDVNNFYFQNFKADYYLSRADDGSSRMKVDETLEAVFPNYDQNHGILRALPDKYKDHSLDLTVSSVTDSAGQAYSYTTYQQNDNLVLRIGDADRYVHGPITYHISYSYKDVISFYKDHDEFFWDVNGDQWGQTFQNVFATVHLPNNLAKAISLQLRCYKGSFGSSAQNCTISTADSLDGKLIESSATNVYPSQTLSVAVGFKKGTFVLSDQAQKEARLKNLDTLAGAAIALLIPIGATAFMWKRWSAFGNDPKGRGVIIPQYEPPKDTSVADNDFIYSQKLRPVTVTATIIDWAVRRHVNIYEEPKKGLFGKKTYVLKLINVPENMSEAEKGIMDLIFVGPVPGSTRSMDELKSTRSRNYKILKTVEESQAEYLTSQGFFQRNPKKIRMTYVSLACALLFSAFLFVFAVTKDSHRTILGVLIGVIAAGLVVLLFSLIMPARTLKGVEVLDWLKGLKDYIKMAEADRLKYLQSPEGAEKITDKDTFNPSKQADKVKLFEKLLPYAVLFGLEKDWAKQFDDIYKAPPDWYSGNWTSFNAGYLAGSLSDFNSFNSTAFTTPSSSGSGFSGGGGAGGGGGGGGGGGW